MKDLTHVTKFFHPLGIKMPRKAAMPDVHGGSESIGMLSPALSSTVERSSRQPIAVHGCSNVLFVKH